MEYNDEKTLSIEEYQLMAKAYADSLNKKGFKLINIGGPDSASIDELFQKLSSIKSLLFCMGGFLGTGQFYSLNERQLEKFKIIFDANMPRINPVKTHDKTRCFLNFLSQELSLINLLNTIAEQSPFEKEIKNMTAQRLTVLSKILAL